MEMSSIADSFGQLFQSPLFGHLQELLVRLRRVVASIFIFLAIFFIFGPGYISVAPTSISIPLIGTFVVTRIPIIVPSFIGSFSNIIVRFLIFREVPVGLTVINVGAFDSVYSSLQVSFLFSIVVSMPVILTQLWKFVSPGLYQKEKQHIRWLIAPAVLLFILGVLFAFFIVIPVLMYVVMLYIKSLGVQSFLSIKSFITIVVGFMLAFGISFEMPVVMATLTKFGVVEARVWVENWRYGILASFIIALLLSPGVTGGLIETVIGLTLSALYVVGALFSSRIGNKQSASKKDTEKKE